MAHVLFLSPDPCLMAICVGQFSAGTFRIRLPLSPAAGFLFCRFLICRQKWLFVSDSPVNFRKQDRRIRFDRRINPHFSTVELSTAVKKPALSSCIIAIDRIESNERLTYGR
jgi:hypothetical protein